MPARSRFCVNGHQYTPATTRVRKNGTWNCKICHVEGERRRRQARLAEDARKRREQRAAFDEVQRARDRAIKRRHGGKRKRATSTDLDALGEYDVILRGDPCCYCGAITTTVDHIDSLARGGEQEWDNLTAACQACNRRKWANSLLTFLLQAAIRRPTETSGPELSCRS